MAGMQLRKATKGPKNAPTSLRERNKAKKCLAMLNATRELLLSEGLDKTTMEAIAWRAEVGVATVYKYFGTKDELLMELVHGDIEEMFDEVSRIVADPPANLADAVIAVLAPPNSLQLARAGASLVRYIIDEMWTRQEEKWRKFARWVITESQARIEALLADFQARGVLGKSVDTRAAARIIYTLFDYNYICFARGEIATLEEMAELTNSQIRMLFGNWNN